MDKPLWLLKAELDLNQKEWPGSYQDNPVILDMFNYVTYHGTHDEVPWCSAAVNKWMTLAGIKGTKSAAAVSWLSWGKDLGDTPKLGCVVVFEWDDGSHHVALYVGAKDEDTIECLGGNQHNMVKVSPYPVANVMSYRWPY
jgi:uncharacterized protein (TIGR02594 family)